jgi:hypothetical protein
MRYAADLRRPISVPELAKASGVSQRVLELGVVPMLDISHHFRYKRVRKQALVTAGRF